MTTHKPDNFYPDSRMRLEAITNDAAMLASFDAMVESADAGDGDVPDNDPRGERWNAAMGDFLADIARLNISRNHVVLDKGRPFLSPEVAA